MIDVPTREQVEAAQLLRHIRAERKIIELMREQAKKFENSTAGSYRLRSGLMDAIDALDHAEDGLVAGYGVEA